jgi:hypothetical protein
MRWGGQFGTAQMDRADGEVISMKFDLDAELVELILLNL